MGPGQDLVMMILEALVLDPPLTLLSDAQHLLGEGFPVGQGVVIEIPLLPRAALVGGNGFGSAIGKDWEQCFH